MPIANEQENAAQKSWYEKDVQNRKAQNARNEFARDRIPQIPRQNVTRYSSEHPEQRQSNSCAHMRITAPPSGVAECSRHKHRCK